MLTCWIYTTHWPRKRVYFWYPPPTHTHIYYPNTVFTVWCLSQEKRSLQVQNQKKHVYCKKNVYWLRFEKPHFVPCKCVRFTPPRLKCVYTQLDIWWSRLLREKIMISTKIYPVCCQILRHVCGCQSTGQPQKFKFKTDTVPSCPQWPGGPSPPEQSPVGKIQCIRLCSFGRWTLFWIFSRFHFYARVSLG